MTKFHTIHKNRGEGVGKSMYFAQEVKGGIVRIRDSAGGAKTAWTLEARRLTEQESYGARRRKRLETVSQMVHWLWISPSRRHWPFSRRKTSFREQQASPSFLGSRPGKWNSTKRAPG